LHGTREQDSIQFQDFALRQDARKIHAMLLSHQRFAMEAPERYNR
jgi:hypothetical protein